MAVRGQPYGKPARDIELMRELLEGAMMYDYVVRVVASGTVYEGQVRLSQFHPFSRFEIRNEFTGVWRELFVCTLTEVRSSDGDPNDD